MFSESFLHLLIIMALIWTAAGALTLIALLVRDWIRGTLW